MEIFLELHRTFYKINLKSNENLLNQAKLCLRLAHSVFRRFIEGILNKIQNHLM